MAFKYNGVEPTAITYNGTDLTVLKYGTTAVWGKPFSLTIQAGANSTVTVNRTSSPNQHAATGAITSGGIVYYGDTLTITVTPASGYKLVSFTINGTEYANSETSAVSQTITVTGAVSVVTATQSAKSWHTAWSGNHTYSMQNFITTGLFIPHTTLNSNYAKTGNMRVTAYFRYNNNYGAHITHKMDWGQAYKWYADGSSYISVNTTETSSSSGEGIGFSWSSNTTFGTREWVVTKIEYYY